MLGHRELTMQDFAAILKRRLWLVLLSTVALFAIAIVLSYIIPPRFQSQTRNGDLLCLAAGSHPAKRLRFEV